MNKIISLAQKWSHSKLGWLANKAGLGVAAILGAIGLEDEDLSKQLIAAVVAAVTVALELGVKVASDRLVGGIQSKFPRLSNDMWPGPKTREQIESNIK